MGAGRSNMDEADAIDAVNARLAEVYSGQQPPLSRHEPHAILSPDEEGGASPGRCPERRGFVPILS
jgi:hypothetical protein